MISAYITPPPFPHRRKAFNTSLYASPFPRQRASVAIYGREKEKYMNEKGESYKTKK
jgi:hypothetical protein